MSEPVAIQQPHVNIFLQLKSLILQEINDALNRAPQAIPCTVVKNNGQTVNVMPAVNTGVSKKLMRSIPIAKSPYLNLPFKNGDRGMLIPSAYLYDDLILTNLSFIDSPKKSTTLSGYVFIPFTNYAQDYAGTDVNNNTKLFSQNGAADIEITNTDFKIKTDEEIKWSKVKAYLDAWQINYNTNITTINANNVIIAGALATLGQVVTLTPLTQYTDTYRG